MRLVTVLAVVSCMSALPAVPAWAAAGSTGYPTIHVLSDRADLISGGDALVSVTLPRGTRATGLRMWLSPSRVAPGSHGRRVTREFAPRPNGMYEGLVTGLRVGPNVLSAVLPGGHAARVTITDHPLQGPVFAGPQPEPWTCEPGAQNKRCTKPPAYSYLYLPEGKTALQAYNPSDPPSNVATTTTDEGVTVPFIVREEIAYEDRDQVRIETLWQPGKTWTPWAAQRQWDHKVLVMGGFDCHDTHGFTPAPWGTILPENLTVPDQEDISVVALGLGFVDMSTSLDNSAVDCDPALQAESLEIAKEHIVDQYGPIEYTIGYGCSGGSIMLQWVANAYPGIFQGLIPQCAFPDAGSSIQQVVDDEALDNYFSAQTNSNPLSWTSSQEAEVDGTAEENLPLTPTDNEETAQTIFPWALPTDCQDYDAGESYVPESMRYNAQSNPGGVRCGLADWNINLFGQQPKTTWDKQEEEVGHGFAGIPIDDVGVQYGLSALEKGEISPAQFANLNAEIGSFNVDWQPVPERIPGNEPALPYAYRTGFINEANNLNQVPIIDLMGPNDPGLVHDTFREFALQARLQRDFGTSANLVIWEGPVLWLGDVTYTAMALRAMDTWLDAIDADRRNRSLPAKVIADKPADIHDQCSNGDGTVLLNTLCPNSIVPVYSSPRNVAGEPLTTDQNSCQLMPLERASYSVKFTAAEWTELQHALPTGVCDWSKPAHGQQPTVPWLTYQTRSGKVIDGGLPMPQPPDSHDCTATRSHPWVCKPNPRR